MPIGVGLVSEFEEEMVNVSTFDTFRARGSYTVTCAAPAAATSAALIEACSRVPFTQVVVRLEPFHCTTTRLLKLAPFTVSVKAAEPAVADPGERLLIAGKPAAFVVWQALRTKQVRM